MGRSTACWMIASYLAGSPTTPRWTCGLPASCCAALAGMGSLTCSAPQASWHAQPHDQLHARRIVVYAVRPAAFMNSLSKPATTASTTILAPQINTSQPSLLHQGRAGRPGCEDSDFWPGGEGGGDSDRVDPDCTCSGRLVVAIVDRHFAAKHII